MDQAERKQRRAQLTSTIFEQVRGIASDLFAVPPERITDESSPETIESWDSPQQLNLILALEERFHFQLSPEEIEQMGNIGEIAKLVERRLQTTRG
jgi:acyl carrier protein